MNGYFDHNATTPLFEEASEAVLQAMHRDWQNPSSLYHEAGNVRRRLEEAREELAEELGTDEPSRIVFTSGATESNNAVIDHVSRVSPERPVVISAVEHPCVVASAHRSFREKVLTLPVSPTGGLELDPLSDWIAQKQPSVVSVMAANNETGILHPWKDLAELCRENGIGFHCDAAQWLGKLPSEDLAACDWITGSAHKFGGPKGIGFLIVPEKLGELHGLQVGGPQEKGRRAGTENYPAIAGMVAALRVANQGISNESGREQHRDSFEEKIQSLIPGTQIIGADVARLWNTSMIIVPEFRNLKWLTRLSHLGFQISTGSACSSGKDNPSHVMAAMGIDYDEMGRVLRLSSGWSTSGADWDALADALVEVWQSLQSRDSKKRRRPGIDLNNPDVSTLFQDEPLASRSDPDT